MWKWETYRGQESTERARLQASLYLPWFFQVVAGMKFYLTMDIESTQCAKTRVSGDHMDLTTCPLAAGEQQEVTALTPS